MIFLSAQPDSVYFTWQLEIQLLNFSSLKISPDNIHVLFSFDPNIGLSSKALDLIENYKDYAKFYSYPDTRENKLYISSIRPHIIKKHYLENEFLKNENIFYHDSDIVFTGKLPDFGRLNKSDIWYFSDTRSYLSATSIINRAGNLVLNEMCHLLEIEPNLVLINDENSGGAQTLLKKVDFQFWEKVEIDCNKLFLLLNADQSIYKEDFEKHRKFIDRDFKRIDPWCSDMWALLWNSFKANSVRLDKDLDFCWPEQDIEKWEEFNIFHNAGVSQTMEGKLFYKSKYMEHEPFDFDFSHLAYGNCSSKYMELLSKLHSKRYTISDCAVLIVVRIDDTERMENLKTVIEFINKYFVVRTFLLEADDFPKVSKESFIEKVHYTFVKDSCSVVNYEYYFNYLAKSVSTEIIIKYDCGVIIPPAQLYSGILKVRYGEAKICYPHHKTFAEVKGTLRQHFITQLDIALVLKYMPEQWNLNPLLGGCVILDKLTFEKFGCYNLNFKGIEFGERELYTRYKIMDLKILRIHGPVIYLGNSKSRCSMLLSNDNVLNNYAEFLRISNMSAEKLFKEISTWKN